MSALNRILVTGGAGYVGSALVPKLIRRGYKVKVLDLYLYGENSLSAVRGYTNLTEVKGDIRNTELLKKEIAGMDAVIHLACISNDPSYELNPELSKTINYDAFLNLVDCTKTHRVSRLIYASSSSVYGIKNEPEVTEDLPLEPLTDYSKYKALCEDYLLKAAGDDLTVTVIRPSTVCGYSPRMRLDLTVNILTNHAVNTGEITVFGGEQKRPNIHIEDMTDLYLFLLKQPDVKIHKKIYNAGYQNYKVREIAEIVRDTLGGTIPIKTVPTDDLRSYHVSSKKIRKELGFVARHSIEQAVLDIQQAFENQFLPEPLTRDVYYNIRTMKNKNLN